MGYGIITLLPALLVIVVAIKSKRTTEALLIGCVSSYLIIATANKSNPVTLMVDSFFKVVTDYDTVWLLIVCGLFGSLIAVINAARGTHAIANFLGKICKTDKSTLLTSWILGIIIFVDDYMNIMTISACTKKLSDSRKVPREALAYVIDSTGAPVCVLLPFSTFNLPNYVMSVVEPFVNANIYPMVAFVVVAMLGFITGSNWGIPAVCAPIIIPLGAACGANLLIVIAAIVCGGTFCSHACFYSDATVITSSSCGIENMEHVYSQLPYTMIAAGIASILFLIAGFIF